MSPITDPLCPYYPILFTLCLAPWIILLIYLYFSSKNHNNPSSGYVQDNHREPGQTSTAENTQHCDTDKPNNHDGGCASGRQTDRYVFEKVHSMPFLGHQIYEELKNLVGEDATRKIANSFNRGSIYFPSPKENFQTQFDHIKKHEVCNG